MVKRIDLAIAYLAELATKQQLTGKIYTFGWEKPNILYLGKFGAMVPKAVQDKAIGTKDAIASHKLTIA